MRQRKKAFLISIFIFLIAFLAGSFVYSWKFLPLPRVPFKLGLDLQGGVHLLYEADFSQIKDVKKSEIMAGLKDVIERRVNLFGVREPVVQVQGERLIVELAGVVDPKEAIKQIGKTPFLEFREQKGNYQEIIEKNRKFAQTGEGEWEDPFRSTPLTGRYLKKAELTFDPNTYKPLVALEFNDEGAKIFEKLTEKNVGKILAIYIDGVPISTPVVQEKISGGRAQIIGEFSVEEAKELARNLNAGALPVPIKLISQQSVGPTLGKISLEKSLKAGVIGFLLVILFMVLVYRIPGVLASLALAIYALVVLAVFKIISVTLTLAGIGGIVLSVGMAVDANILIFSRMREELKSGKELSLAIEEGFQRAWPSIRDGNLTTLIVALILFSFGTSFVKGFATTLSLGIIFSMVSAIFVTKNFLKCFINTPLEKLKILW